MKLSVFLCHGFLLSGFSSDKQSLAATKPESKMRSFCRICWGKRKIVFMAEFPFPVTINYTFYHRECRRCHFHVPTTSDSTEENTVRLTFWWLRRLNYKVFPTCDLSDDFNVVTNILGLKLPIAVWWWIGISAQLTLHLRSIPSSEASVLNAVVLLTHKRNVSKMLTLSHLITSNFVT